MHKVLRIYYIIVNIFRLKVSRVKVKEIPRINGFPKIYNKGRIEIGKGVTINSNISSNPIGGDGVTVLCTQDNGHIIIGDKVQMSNIAIYSIIKVTIEENVYIGGGCKIYDTDFHSLLPDERIRAVDTNICSTPVKIGRNAFIGAHSIILKGVCIGEAAVVGAGSVVTKSIPPYEVWAGNPAKFIKSLRKNVC